MQRILLIVLVIVLVAAGVGFLVLDRQHQAALANAQATHDEALAACREDAMAVARELAADIARVLSATVADEVARGDENALDPRLAAVVQGNRVLSVLVLAPGGRVLAATDLRFRGRALDDDASRAALAADEPMILHVGETPGQVQAAAPLRHAGERVGAVLVAVAVGTAGAA